MHSTVYLKKSPVNSYEQFLKLNQVFKDAWIGAFEASNKILVI